MGKGLTKDIFFRYMKDVNDRISNKYGTPLTKNRQ